MPAPCRTRADSSQFEAAEAKANQAQRGADQGEAAGSGALSSARRGTARLHCSLDDRTNQDRSAIAHMPFRTACLTKFSP